MEKQPKKERLPKDDVILHFVLDGVKYALKHNTDIPDEQMYENLKTWFPDVEIYPSDIDPNK